MCAQVATNEKTQIITNQEVGMPLYSYACPTRTANETQTMRASANTAADLQSGESSGSMTILGAASFFRA